MGYGGLLCAVRRFSDLPAGIEIDFSIADCYNTYTHNGMEVKHETMYGF